MKLLLGDCDRLGAALPVYPAPAAAMLGGVRRAADERQIGQSVIQGVAIEMMDNHPWRDHAVGSLPDETRPQNPNVRFRDFDECARTIGPAVATANPDGAHRKPQFGLTPGLELSRWGEVDALLSSIPGADALSKHPRIPMLPGMRVVASRRAESNRARPRSGTDEKRTARFACPLCHDAFPSGVTAPSYHIHRLLSSAGSGITVEQPEPVKDAEGQALMFGEENG